MKKYLITSALLLSSSAFANTPPMVPDIVQLAGPYSITAQQALDSHVNLYVTDHSTATIGIDGGDVFDQVNDNSNSLVTKISDNKKAVFVKNGLKPGEKASLGITSKCGITVSVTINSLEPSADTQQIKPKLQITAPTCAEVTK